MVTRRLGWRPHSFWRSSKGSWKVRGSYCPIFLIVFLSCQHPVDRFRQVTSCCNDCHFFPSPRFYFVVYPLEAIWFRRTDCCPIIALAPWHPPCLSSHASSQMAWHKPMCQKHLYPPSSKYSYAKIPEVDALVAQLFMHIQSYIHMHSFLFNFLWLKECTLKVTVDNKISKIYKIE